MRWKWRMILLNNKELKKHQPQKWLTSSFVIPVWVKKIYSSKTLWKRFTRMQNLKGIQELHFHPHFQSVSLPKEHMAQVKCSLSCWEKIEVLGYLWDYSLMKIKFQDSTIGIQLVQSSHQCSPTNGWEAVWQSILSQVFFGGWLMELLWRTALSLRSKIKQTSQQTWLKILLLEFINPLYHSNGWWFQTRY